MPETPTLRDPAFVGVGLAVLAVRQANDAIAEFEKRLTDGNETIAQGINQTRERLAALRTQVEEFWTPYADRVQEQIDQLIDRLPEQAQKTYKDAVKAGKDFVASLEQFTKSVQEGPSAKPAAKKPATPKAVA
jgi:uncharacterized phage infection (PIP) family protein YhgE